MPGPEAPLGDPCGDPGGALARRRGLRVLYLHQHFSRPEGRVPARSFHMAAALAAAGHEVTLACGRYAGAESGLDAPFLGGVRTGAMEGFAVQEFDIPAGNAQGLPARARAFLRYAGRATALALRGRWDVVVASSTPLTVALPALAARRLRGTPFVFEMRDPWPELPRALSAAAPAGAGRVPGPVLRVLDRLADAACREAAMVLALTGGMADLAVARGADPARVRVVPQGVDLDLFSPRAAPWRPSGVAREEFVAVYAGAHGPANGLDALLDAAALLRGAGIRIVLAGAGGRRAALRARAAAEALPVVFLDPMPRPALAGLLAGAQAGLLCLAPVPDFAEWSAPNKLAEALAAGLPVVANVPGAAARLLAAEGCGVAVPPGDPVALAAALRGLAADPDRRAALGRAARRAAERHHDIRRGAALLVAAVEAAVPA